MLSVAQHHDWLMLLSLFDLSCMLNCGRMLYCFCSPNATRKLVICRGEFSRSLLRRHWRLLLRSLLWSCGSVWVSGSTLVCVLFWWRSWRQDIFSFDQHLISSRYLFIEKHSVISLKVRVVQRVHSWMCILKFPFKNTSLSISCMLNRQETCSLSSRYWSYS